ncbi:SDR family NAD(P)-dependent oxidoreductase [Hymenobacter cellulosilyticus]|uniref:SDR family NAD(P)-dependent oxidoreductase n=1 Tax=Hymenobacter cellulosilyticus TaxID=2932248 RepID=A0A8T9Q2X9_9BACT|nr:SDR family NAD(P)-dependent oxidoreductase [Hymenobacter cellulosilyticus]UOQ71322.1 SDR family NAD(P)-dependent oxidoreductase [Hymenobacter cellulosilyticus]
MKRQTRNNWLAAAGAGALMAAATLFVNRRGSYDLNGRVVLITGGSRGLGLVLARQAVVEGARVAICARDADELERARQDLRACGAADEDVLTLAHDITSETEVRSMVAEVETRFGPIDVLINNAGIILGGPLENMDVRDYEECMALHFWAPLHAMYAVLPSMRRRGAGRIVNISSLGGKVALPHLMPYSASKFALVGLSEGFRSELRQYDISVTTVCPGLMRTGSPGHAMVKGQQQKEYAWFSVADSLPGITMSADQAARQIWNACRRGDGEVILSLPAKLLAAFHGLLPGTTTDILSWLNRALPATGESPVANVRRTGYESESAVSRSPLTTLTRKAARENNE